MQFGLLGPLQVTTTDGDDLVVRGSKQRALLSLLLLGRGRPVSVDRLIDGLWDQPPGNPANALQAQVSQLRRLLGSDAIRSVEAGYLLGLEPGQLDLDAFDELIHRGAEAVHAGDAPSATRLLDRALQLWRGDPLVDVDAAEIATPERSRLHELRHRAIELRAEALLAVGRAHEVTNELEGLVAEHPTRERFWELLMLALYRTGRQADALRAYQRARSALIEEVGVEPGPALKELEARILGHDETLAAVAPPPIKGNLAQPLTPLIGRSRERDDLTSLLVEHRLVTVVGPGGAGKTRLATEVGMLQVPDGGSWFVALESVRDPAGVVPAIASALGARTSEHPAGSASSPLTAIVNQLDHRPVLLVLDNCEHVVERVAEVVAELLGRSPHLRVLATSREPLGVSGETLFPLGSLDPQAATDLFLTRARAVRPDLDIDEVALSVVERICERLDGLPLAIELAAGRARALPLTQIADRLDDRFQLLTGGARTVLPRQQTLRAVVDWSYELLSDDERRLFGRLSVFTGGWSLHAAEAICADEDLPRPAILDLLGRLVERSLVVPDSHGDQPRYRMLQTLSHYARERLDGDVSMLRHRHAEYYRQLAEHAEPRMRSGEALVVRRELAPDIDNLWSTLGWLDQTNAAAAALRYCDDLAWLWFLIGDWPEGARFCRRALEVEGEAAPAERGLVEIWWAYYLANASGHRAVIAEIHAGVDLEAAMDDVIDAGDPIATAKAMLLRVNLTQRGWDVDLQLRLVEDGMAAAAATEEPWFVGTAEMLAAGTMLRLGRNEQAADLAASAVRRFDELGDPTLSIEARTALLTVAELEGRLDDAARDAEAILRLTETLDIPSYRQWALSRLGFVRQAAGDLRGADDAHMASIAIGRSRWGTALATLGRGLVARGRGELDAARRHLDAATSAFADLGAAAESALARALAGWVELDRDNSTEARRLATEALSTMTSLTDAGVAALASEVLAAAALAEGERQEAESVLQPTASIGISAGHGLWLLTRPDSQRLRSALAEHSTSTI
ncbi:MAG TPA: BTAD domain-containing putative transcriptional regulator [Acidimicrobiales bacterium]|nr:BTAD domain-containing putative transcriptional regulator [Acidimicrobiales bacterium]